MIEEKKQENTSDNAWLRPVMIFYAKVTSWIIFPLIITVLLGQYASVSVGSQSLFFLAVIVGFFVTCYGIYKEIKEYKKDLDKDSKNGNK